jgi:hypothetical protein
MLKETGTLAAILPVGFISNSQKKEHDFLKKVLLSGSYYKHEKGSFKEFGTMVDTCTVVMNKDCSWKYNEHYSGHKNYFIWLFGMYTNNEEPLMRQKEKLFASNPNDEAYLEYINLIIDNAEKKGDGLDTELIPDYMAYLKRDYADEYGEDEVCEPAVEHSAEKESYVSAHKQAEIITNGGNLFDIMNVA